MPDLGVGGRHADERALADEHRREAQQRGAGPGGQLTARDGAVGDAGERVVGAVVEGVQDRGAQLRVAFPERTGGGRLVRGGVAADVALAGVRELAEVRDRLPGWGRALLGPADVRRFVELTRG